MDRGFVFSVDRNPAAIEAAIRSGVSPAEQANQRRPDSADEPFALLPAHSLRMEQGLTRNCRNRQ
ncbi:MAG TPA: hypothetical protein PKW88_10555, partial [Plasticicumulans sp.]|nr:hypothetical protein [Plasticicumulans sp.]